MADHQIPHHRLRHLLRAGNRRLSVTRRKPAHFDDVAALIFQRSRHLVQRVLRRLAQHALPRTEANLGIPNALVLIQVAHHLLFRRDPRRRLRGRSLRQLRLVRRVGRVLVRQAALLRRQLNALRRPCIHVFDHLAVFRGQLIQLVDPVADRPHLPLHILLAGKRMRHEIHQVRIISIPEIPRSLRRQRFPVARTLRSGA